MAKVLIGEKELELILEEKVVEKARQLNVSDEMIHSILQDNENALKEPENEEVLIIGSPSITFIKKAETIVVTNLIQNKVFTK
jgi:hypothetical protein